MTEVQPGGGGGPTVRRMLVGARLRRLRIEASLTREQAGEALRASEWKIHRLENGQVSFKDRDVADLLALYGVTDAGEVEALLAMAREANRRGWWHQYGELLPQWFRAYIDLESAASLIRTYQGQLVPGLLQTEEYARAVIEGGHAGGSPDEVERRVALRMARQALFARSDGRRLWAVVDEAALRRPVGGPEVMRTQIERLVEASKLRNVTLQVLPVSAGAHPAILGGFSILRFADQDLPDVVYVEHLTSAVYLNKPDHVDHYLQAMEMICRQSGRASRTADILGEILDGG